MHLKYSRQLQTRASRARLEKRDLAAKTIFDVAALRVFPARRHCNNRGQYYILIRSPFAVACSRRWGHMGNIWENRCSFVCAFGPRGLHRKFRRLRSAMQGWTQWCDSAAMQSVWSEHDVERLVRFCARACKLGSVGSNSAMFHQFHVQSSLYVK